LVRRKKTKAKALLLCGSNTVFNFSSIEPYSWHSNSVKKLRGPHMRMTFQIETIRTMKIKIGLIHVGTFQKLNENQTTSICWRLELWPKNMSWTHSHNIKSTSFCKLQCLTFCFCFGKAIPVLDNRIWKSAQLLKKHMLQMSTE